MDRWKSEIVVKGLTYIINLNRRYSPAVSEHLFDLEILKGDEAIFENSHNIYSRRDSETWIRQALKCKGKRFVWTERL
jgi:hypothetical protein